jgi:hypothetical protein
VPFLILLIPKDTHDQNTPIHNLVVDGMSPVFMFATPRFDVTTISSQTRIIREEIKKSVKAEKVASSLFRAKVFYGVGVDFF